MSVLVFFGRVGLRARMTDFGTLLPSIGTALFSLAVLSLVLWPALVALLEISKAIRSAVPANKEPTPFVLTNTGETIWFAASRNAVSKSPSMGEKRLRFSVLFACGMEAAFIVFLTVFLFQHAFAFAYGPAFAVLYVVALKADLALFTVYPSLGIILLGTHHVKDVADPAMGFVTPAMYWYGWSATAALGALVFGFIAALLPERWAQRVWSGWVWTIPAGAMIGCVYLTIPWFRL